MESTLPMALRQLILQSRNSGPIQGLSFDTVGVWEKDSETTHGEERRRTSLTPQEERAVALLADVSEKTVRRYLSGRPTRPGSSRRIELALRALMSAKAG